MKIRVEFVQSYDAPKQVFYCTRFLISSGVFRIAMKTKDADDDLYYTTIAHLDDKKKPIPAWNVHSLDTLSSTEHYDVIITAVEND
jgi:hypothetical protein